MHTLGLREQQRKNREAAILEAATTLFRSRGYAMVTTKDIAAEACVGEATLFRYFASKHDIFFASIGTWMTRVIDLILEEDDARTSTTGDECLSRVIDIYRRRAERFIEDPGNTLTFALLGLEPAPELHGPPITQGDRVVKRVTSILEDGQARGLLNPDVSAAMIATNLNGTYIHEMSRGTSRGLPVDTFPQRLTDRLVPQLSALEVR